VPVLAATYHNELGNIRLRSSSRQLFISVRVGVFGLKNLDPEGFWLSVGFPLR
jgi:hypothetical protein